MWAFWVLKSSYPFRFENFHFWYPSKIEYTPPPTAWSSTIGVARIAFPIWHIVLKFDCTQIQSLCLWGFYSSFFRFYVFLSQPDQFYRLIAGVECYCSTWPHSMTHTRSTGLLWPMDRFVADTSTWQYWEHSQRTDIHDPGGISECIIRSVIFSRADSSDRAV